MKKSLIFFVIFSVLTGVLSTGVFADTVTKTITYEENFDNIPDGGLPEGWTLYSNKDKTKTTAVVRDGALYLKNTEWYGDEWLLFDNITDVERTGLSMECDITLAEETTNAQRGNSCAGFGYMAKMNGIGVSGSWAALRTDLQATGVSEPEAQRGYVVDAGKTRGQINFTAASNNTEDGEMVLAVNKNDGQPVHFKIEFTNDKQTPVIYLNNKKLNYYQASSDSNTTRGAIGLYICNASVKIDNVKVTCTAMIPDTKTYTAEFKTPGGKYDSAEAAKDDVVVSECDYFGVFERDITAESIIEAEEDGNGNITVRVTYGDFTKTLVCKLTEFDLITVSDAQASPNGVHFKVTNNSKKSISAVAIVRPMQEDFPCAKTIFYKLITLEPQEKNKETEFSFEYDEDFPECYELYFINGFEDGFRAAAPMVKIKSDK